ncbi:MAG: protein translocase subunit SecF [Candidatus Colwellbacteria bacterium CG10_big_fil_rev_8_21_14_0_10_41_28]|uniref:Protein-export membrane protein SecF n=1 Tax=Candidatus Colwellbacteria bacterium CG10_big_fil_rev_8_21_14_0_10_41_28 TaxID=1974539 RepID=A0A2H0VH40_9BACT|nr:MAG: protein translocase subunit SecF [Candidatus Colwellbacteria bacterium CG10_big_fil_rev_8_21_14_0_10_41_28]
MMKKILKFKKVFLGFSLLLALSSGIVILIYGFNPGIDFTSGSLWQIRVPESSSEEVRDFIETEYGIDKISIAFDETENIYTLTFKEINDTERKEIISGFEEKFGEGVEDLDFWSVSPTVSQELKDKAKWAIGLVLLGISLFIAFAFRKVSRPISSWKYGIITLITLSHDVLIPAGLFSLLGTYAGVTVGTNFMVALLVVMGFSVHDTIVVFDRIRENLTRYGNKLGLEEIVDKSVIDTLARSINTSITLIFVLVAIYLWGPVSLQYFILAILVGTIAGTYSSIFVASPLLILAKGKGK